jgi:asparagine synthase (glutamine-hydrolysing)
MCGIAGWVSDAPIDPAILRRMGSALARRGPDGEGLWVSSDGRAGFVHRRLSIIDLSDGGAQPFSDASLDSAFVHNGEIYNAPDLRARLGVGASAYRGHSDGEVAFRTLVSKGENAIPEWEGMFAAAYWDGFAGRLTLARDRIGIKPLYYAERGRQLLFASQPAAILAHPAVSRTLDAESMGDYLSYGYVPYDRCIFAGIRKLPAAHVLSWTDGRARVSPYWALERQDPDCSPERLRFLLETAVGAHAVADVPVGAFLSGGLDSGSVSAILANNSAGPIDTFALAYQGGGQDDIFYAEQCARRMHARHHVSKPELGEPRDALDRIGEAFDEPISDATSLAVFDLAREARQHVKVVVSGDGGDEVFGGYGWIESLLTYEARRQRLALLEPLLDGVGSLANRIARVPYGARVAGAAKFLDRDPVARYFHFRGIFSGAEQSRLLGHAPAQEPAWLFRKFYRTDLPLTHRLLYLDLMSYLPDNNLALVDRASMAHGLEVRVPLLDRLLVEFGFSLPQESLICPGRTKILFRRAIADLLPPSVLDRPKYGFSPPFKTWASGPHREAILRSIETGSLARDGVIQPRAMRRFVAERHPRRFNKLWALFVLERWYRRWISGERIW